MKLEDVTAHNGDLYPNLQIDFATLNFLQFIYNFYGPIQIKLFYLF